jgi:hypothetical protein
MLLSQGLFFSAVGMKYVVPTALREAMELLGYKYVALTGLKNNLLTNS